MSMQSLERAVLAETRAILKNPKIRKADIVEWSTAPLDAPEAEIVIRLPELGVNVAIKKDLDKRPPADAPAAAKPEGEG